LRKDFPESRITIRSAQKKAGHFWILPLKIKPVALIGLPSSFFKRKVDYPMFIDLAFYRLR
jgi:hypothetical protein